MAVSHNERIVKCGTTAQQTSFIHLYFFQAIKSPPGNDKFSPEKKSQIFEDATTKMKQQLEVKIIFFCWLKNIFITVAEIDVLF